MSKPRRAVGWALACCSLLLHAFTFWIYARQPDSLAAFTVFPIWMWGGIGLLLSVLAFCFLRSRLSLMVTAIWAVTLPFAMDEAKVLSNFNHSPIEPDRQKVDGKRNRLIRIATVNCADFGYGNPMDDLRKWNPDIVLIQQAAPSRVKELSETLYKDGGDFRAHAGNGIITRFEIRQEVINPRTRNQQVTLVLPGGTEIEVVNIHLASAATDLRLWNSESRATHRSNRNLRLSELSAVLQILERSSSFPAKPTILGGDFNSGANDIVHRLLVRDFEDVFSQVGRGWGNTFHRRFAILRIDQIYATRQLRPVASGVIVSKKTDHRIVIADLAIHN